IARKTKPDELLIDRQAIFHEGDLQFLSLHVSAQAFQMLLSGLERSIGFFALMQSHEQLAHLEICLIAQHGRVEISQYAQSRGALRDCLLDLTAASTQPRHEQATEHGFALQSGGIKKLRSEERRVGKEGRDWRAEG